ncbi:MAG: GTPase ObgE [Pseudomonadota bacterium]
MKFIDEANITVESGKGGSGCVSFRREKFIPKGGPDGGSGGRGGDIILVTSSRKRTLYDFNYKKCFKAQNGSGGEGNQRTGKDGDDLIIEIPPGTLVVNVDTGEPIKDFVNPDETFVLAKGGRGGQGNTHFKTSTHQTPRFAQPGEPAETLNIRLELKLIADVGLVGLPNAGKSTLISAISSARPKIGAYPFTTLIPNLGVVKPRWGGEAFVVADIPGLIEGAHAGAGLGIQFLRHVERTRFLVHLIDVSAIDSNDPLEGYETINHELTLYSELLSNKPQIVVLSKMDLTGAEEAADSFQKAIESHPAQKSPNRSPKRSLVRISAVTGSGIDDLISTIVSVLDAADENRQENEF